MNGNLLSRPKKARPPTGPSSPANRSKCASKSRKNLVTKISATLEPLLGAESLPRRRIGGLRPDQRRTAGRRLSTPTIGDGQFAKDGRATERARTSGVPGTASNAAASPRPPPPRAQRRSRRTENITYQTSRVGQANQVPAGRSSGCRSRCWWTRTVQVEGTRRQRSQAQFIVAARARKTEDDPRSGRGHYRVQRRAGRPVDHRNTAV